MDETYHFALPLALPRETQHLVAHLVQSRGEAYTILRELLLYFQRLLIGCNECPESLAPCTRHWSGFTYPALQSALPYTSLVVRTSSVMDLAYFSSMSARDLKNIATC
jgi:hypothetical protein